LRARPQMLVPTRAVPPRRRLTKPHVAVPTPPRSGPGRRRSPCCEQRAIALSTSISRVTPRGSACSTSAESRDSYGRTPRHASYDYVIFTDADAGAEPHDGPCQRATGVLRHVSLEPEQSAREIPGQLPRVMETPNEVWRRCDHG
jgi:hypothetical protein